MKRFMLLFMALLPAIALADALTPQSLKCEYLHNPEAVDETCPRLSWVNRMNGNDLGQRQTAWQIQVSSSEKALENGDADVWDSGKVEEESTPYKIYAGKALEPARKYWWRVRVWNAGDEVSGWSETAFWATGLMGGWKAQWIGAPWDKEGPRDILEGKTLMELYPSQGGFNESQKLSPSTPAPIFKKDFTIEKKVASARLYITGLGYFEASLNGEKLGDGLLSPNQTDYTKRESMDKRRLPLVMENTEFSVMYLGYDLTDMVKEGENSIECIVGNGFFNSAYCMTAGYGSPRMIAQMEISYEDGSRETVTSDCSWKVRESCIRHNDVFAGEVVDARMKDTPWQQPVVRKSPDGKLTAQSGPEDRIVGTFKPESIEKLQDGSYKILFSEEMSGRVKLEGIPGNAGDTVKVRFLNASVADYDYNGTITYISDGEKGSYATKFSWFTFYGCVVSGWNGNLSADNITAEKINSDLEICGSFKCSDQRLEKLVEMWQRTQKNNMHGGAATDCPHRERGPYTGDGQLACATVMHNFDARAFYLKWIKDMKNSQDSVKGYVPNSSPWEPGCGGGVAWGAAMTIMPWEYYLAYGDKKLLEENYSAMKKQTDYIKTWITKEGLIHAKVPGYCMNIGEHVPPFTCPTEEFMHTFVWWQCCDIMYMAAEALGYDDEAYKYWDLCGDILMQFIAKYYNAVEGSYGKDQCDVMALRMGVLESEKVVEDLKRKLAAHDGHVLTGYIGTRIFFETLSEYGLDDEAWHALTADGYPGYMDMIKDGGTTMWEQWDGKHSHDHPALGSGLVWLYRNLTGVKTDRTAPAYRHFFVSPYIPENLNYASYAVETPYGLLESGWMKTPAGFTMDITVPEGCSCTLTWPIKNTEAEGIGAVRNFDGTYTLQSGTYHLTSK